MSTPYPVTLIPGDGIGPEVVEAARRALEATGVSFAWDVQQVGAPALEACGTPLPDSVAQSVVRNRVALKGPVSTPKIKGFRSVNIALRIASGLYANVRPCRTYPGIPGRFTDVDVVVIRDVTEDLYAGVEADAGTPAAIALIETIRHVLPEVTVAPESALTIRPISEAASRRIVKFAFRYARDTGRRKVTAVHKSGVLKATDGLFLSTAREVAAANSDIEFDDVAVDALAMHLVRQPERFDVLVMPMQYGDIISDLCAGLVGGPGVAPGANYGEHAVLFEPGHGSAPHMAGQDRANPFATMLSGAMLLRHLGEIKAADLVDGAIAATIRRGKAVTYDLTTTRDPNATGTAASADAVIAQMEVTGS